jgi:hypothetical protein
MTTMEKLCSLLAFTLLAGVGTVAAQTAPAQTAPAQPATQQPPQAAEKPTLNLRLNERDLRSAIPYTPTESDRKKGAGDGLPGLGGKPSTSWDQPTPEQVVPKSNDRL